MDEMDVAIQEFLVESDENLSQVEKDLLELESHPDGQEVLASIFRAIHTVKGTCSFLGYSKLESLAHTGETLLSLLRDGELALSGEITTALLSMVDAIRKMLACIQKSNNDGEEEFVELKGVLTRLQTGNTNSVEAPPSTPADPSIDSHEAAFPVSDEEQDAPLPDGQSDELAEESGAISDLPHLNETLSQLVPGGDKTDKGGGTPGLSAVDSSIRVDVGLLDRLMNMVGELVLTRNQILQCPMVLNDPSLQTSSQRLSLITSELQEGIMKTRMQPIGNIFGKFPRVVRDLALACGKHIRIEMEGKGTELDKTLIEAIKDPLTHLVRNSVDHGIELPEVREARGKSREGMLLLRAYHEGGQVNIEITDDGGGINTQRVAETATKRGVVTAEQIAKMSERELLNLIFLPGFSTAAQVTNVSGRGVGMDVVKTNIEKIGGTIDIQTKLGKGTTFKLKVPLTLAIIPALIITTGGERFAIPQVSLLELVRLEGGQIKKFIDSLHGASVCRLRGSLLPLLYLADIVGLRSVAERPVRDEDQEAVMNIVVLQADGQRFGLVVEEINDTEEIVVKPLSKQLKGIPVFAGATIMGDGRVALILDVLGLANRAGMAIHQVETSKSEQGEPLKGGGGHRQTVLLVRVGASRQLAIPLSMVARLEEIPLSALEEAGGQQVMQYRGEILPLIRLGEILGTEGALEDLETGQMVVIVHEQKRIGLMVEKIVDIVDEEIQVKRRSAQAGIVCSAVIQGRVTDVLNVQQIINDHAGLPEEELAAAFVEV